MNATGKSSELTIEKCGICENWVDARSTERATVRRDGFNEAASICAKCQRTVARNTQGR